MYEVSLNVKNSAVIAVSCVAFVCLTTVVLSCGICRKFLKRKKNKNKKDDKNEVEVPHIELAENGDCEKGIPNPGYDTNIEAAQTNGTTDRRVKKEEEVTVAIELISDNNGNSPQQQKIEKPIEEEIQPAQESVQEAELHVSPQIDHEEGSLHGKQMETQQEETSENEEINGGVDNPALQNEEETQKDPEQQASASNSSSAASSQSESDEDNTFESYDGLMLLGGWRRKVLLRDILEAGLVDKDTVDEAIDELRLRREDLIRQKEEAAGTEDDVTMDPDEDDYVPPKLRQFLCGEEPVAGILVSESGEKKSIYRSAKEGLIRRGTAISMLEAQAATGNIIDPVTGRKMSVKDAAQLGLLDKVYETVLTRAERAVTGYKTRASEDILSLYQAMQKGLVVESHGLRLLEAQFSTGGLIDHKINARLPARLAIERKIINEELNKKLEAQDTAESGTFFDPNTEESVTYKELMRRSVLDTDTGLRLYPLENIGRRRYSYGSYSGRSSLASSRSLSRASSRESIPSAVSNN